MPGENEIIFHEEQKFSSYLSIPIIIVMTLAVGISGFSLREMIYEQSLRNILPFLLLIIAGIVIPVTIGILFLTLKLQTIVRPDGLYVRFFPIHINYKKFTTEDLSEYYAIRYRPIIEYGGWGIKWGKLGKAFNVSGNWGLQLILKNGKRLLIGSQKADELAAAIESLFEAIEPPKQNETSPDCL